MGLSSLGVFTKNWSLEGIFKPRHWILFKSRNIQISWQGEQCKNHVSKNAKLRIYFALKACNLVHCSENLYKVYSV